MTPERLISVEVRWKKQVSALDAAANAQNSEEADRVHRRPARPRSARRTGSRSVGSNSVKKSPVRDPGDDERRPQDPDQHLARGHGALLRASAPAAHRARPEALRPPAIAEQAPGRRGRPPRSDVPAAGTPAAAWRPSYTPARDRPPARSSILPARVGCTSRSVTRGRQRPVAGELEAHPRPSGLNMHARRGSRAFAHALRASSDLIDREPLLVVVVDDQPVVRCDAASVHMATPSTTTRAGRRIRSHGHGSRYQAARAVGRHAHRSPHQEDRFLARDDARVVDRAHLEHDPVRARPSGARVDTQPHRHLARARRRHLDLHVARDPRPCRAPETRRCDTGAAAPAVFMICSRYTFSICPPSTSRASGSRGRGSRRP